MVYDLLMVTRQKGERTLPFLERALSVDTASAAVKDYYLSALLLDKRLEEFVTSLPAFYNVSDSVPLPKHYKEALVLYNKITENAPLQIQDAELEEAYSKLLALEREHQDILVRSNYTRRFFGNTYWWYYLYADK